MHIIGNEKRLNIGFLLGKRKLATSAAENYLQEGTYLLLAAAAAAAAAAASCRRNKQHQAPTSKSAAYPAFLGTRWNQRHHKEKIALIFSLSSSSATT